MDSRGVAFVLSGMGGGAVTARFGAIKAGYESYYLRATAPEGGRGFWVRYTVRVAPGEEPSGSLWFTWFDAAGPIATKLTSHEVTGNGASLGSWVEIAGGDR